MNFIFGETISLISKIRGEKYTNLYQFKKTLKAQGKIQDFIPTFVLSGIQNMEFERGVKAAIATEIKLQSP